MAAMFKWKERQKPPVNIGDRRIVYPFLLLPKKLNGEWRWLGVVAVEQEYRRYRDYPPEGPAMDFVGWRDIGWGLK